MRFPVIMVMAIVSLMISLSQAHAIYIERAPIPTKVLTIAADEWCPINCKPGTEKPGVGIELAKKVFEPLGYQVRYVVMPWADALKQVRVGKVDAVIGANHHDDPTLIFPNTAIYTMSDDFYVNNGISWRFQGDYTLKNKRVGVIEGYGYGDIVQKYLNDNKAKQSFVQVSSGDDALLQNINKLRAHKIDIVIESKPVMDYYLQTHNLTNEFAWAGGVPQDKVYLAFSPVLLASKERAAQYDGAIRMLALEPIYARYSMRPIAQ